MDIFTDPSFQEELAYYSAREIVSQRLQTQVWPKLKMASQEQLLDWLKQLDPSAATKLQSQSSYSLESLRSMLMLVILNNLIRQLQGLIG